MQIYAYLQNMSDGDWMPHVPQDVMKDIQDKHDAIEVYCVAHPGESQSTVIADGKRQSVVLKWFNQVIDYIKEKIPFKTPVYYLHNTDNSHAGRKLLGEVVNTFKDAKNNVYAIIRRFKDLLNVKTSVASFEAPLNFKPGAGVVNPGDIGEISAIALADGEINQPAFAGAVKMAALQCLKGDSNMTLSELIEALKGHPEFNTVNPLEVFKEEQILDLEPVQKKLSNQKGSENLYYETQRIKAEKEKLKETLTEREKQLQESQTTIFTYKVKDTFAEELGKRKDLTPAHMKFIELEKGNMKVSPDTDIPTQVNSFLDGTLQKFKAQAELFGVKTDEKGEPLPQPKGGLSSEAAAYLPVTPGI